MNTNTFLKNKLMLFASIIFCIQGFAQNQSMLLPVPGIYSTSTNDYEGCKIINFINPGNPVIYELPKHTFYVEGIKGRPHVEYDLEHADPSMNEKYLGQHPMFAQNIVHDKDGIYKTTDFGNTWNKIVTQWSIKTMYVLDSCILYLMYSDMGGDGSFGIDSCLHTNLTCPFFIGMDLLNKDSGFCVIDKIYKRGILSNINEVEKQKIEIYPNPFKDKIIITLSSDIDILEINLMVYNSIGQKILYNPNLKNNHIIIDLADEPNGLYYLTIRDNNKIIRTEKLLKL